jgi:para-nitrobenzyl esterase
MCSIGNLNFGISRFPTLFETSIHHSKDVFIKPLKRKFLCCNKVAFVSLISIKNVICSSRILAQKLGVLAMLTKLMVAVSIQVSAAIAPLLLLPFHFSSNAADSINTAITQIDSGWVQGVISDEVLSFKGIPYAAPPIGRLRWRSPQPVRRWSGIRQAIQYGNDCMQFPDPSDVAPLGTAPSEDCLVLNVWRPAQIESETKLPVVVWIHGGAFVNGGSSPAIYDGSEFARQGVIFVSFNYRLGRFGFFAHPALRAERESTGSPVQRSEPIANYGFMDQLAALRWVQRNSAALGGNPNKVTVMGGSAGGISVMHLLTWQAASSLFHQAIVLSGGGRDYLVNMRKLRDSIHGQPAAEASGLQFARSLGIQRDDAAGLAALRALPASQIAKDLNLSNLVKKLATYAGGPIQDGEIVTATPGEILQRGVGAKMPMMIGSTTSDSPAILPSLSNPLEYFGDAAATAKSIYNPKGALTPFDLLLKIGVDISIHEPARFVAKQMTALGQPVWLYRFGYVARSQRPKISSAPHASELPFLFGTLNARYGAAATPEDETAGQQFRSYIVNFIKIGNPNGSRLPLWTRFNPARSQLLIFTPDDGPVMQVDPWKDRLDLVERVVNSKTEASATK